MSECGFEALRLSICGASRLFGGAATYVVCVNSAAVDAARARVGPLPVAVEWRSVSAADVPDFIRTRLDQRFAEGAGWKFAPLRVAEGAFELALDNDCILWEMPEPLAAWLDGNGNRALVAEDVSPCFGRFAQCCGGAPRNGGLRGVPPHWPLAEEMADLLALHPEPLSSELDEQGLQVAALTRRAEPLVVTTEDVTICSPFHPHQPYLGRCGAHFVGLNANELPWRYEGRPAVDLLREHWDRHRAEVAARVGI